MWYVAVEVRLAIDLDPVADAVQVVEWDVIVMVSLTWRSVLVIVVVTGTHEFEELVVACTTLPKDPTAATTDSRRIVRLQI